MKSLSMKHLPVVKHSLSLLMLLTAVLMLSSSCETAGDARAKGPQTPAIDADAQPQKETQIQKEIQVIGASTPYPALELLAEAYAEAHPQTTISFLDSSQSSGGIAGVKQGLVDIGTVTRLPKPTEAERGLSYQALAQDVLLVATHPSVVDIDNLTTDQLKAIYSGETTNWKTLGGPDAGIIVLDRAEDTSAKRLLRKYYLGPDLRNAEGAIMLRRESDVRDSLQSIPYSIGIISRSRAIAEALPINPLSLNNIAPNPENIQTGDYAMHRTLGIVWYQTPSETTQSFLDFAVSQRGAEILTQAGFVVISPTSDENINKDTSK